MATPVAKLTDLVRVSELRRDDHVSLSRLRSYHQKELAGPDQEEVAVHLAVCEECRILLSHVVIPSVRGNGGDKNQLKRAWRKLRPRLPEPVATRTSVADLLRGKPLPTSKVLRLGTSIARVLHCYHSEGRLLQGFRAEDVQLNSENEVARIHHGFPPLARIIEIGGKLTAEELIVQWLSSASPEQVRGDSLNDRSDLFSLGALLYEMVTAVAPFHDSSPMRVAAKILTLDPAPARELNPKVVPALSDLIEELLKKEPEDRPRSAGEVVEIIEAINADLSGGNSGRRKSVSDDADTEIGRLYKKIATLTREADPLNPKRQTQLDEAFERLLHLQTAEAARYRAQFEADLAMPIDAGASILARVEALRRKLEDLTSAHPAPNDSNNSQAPSEEG